MVQTNLGNGVGGGNATARLAATISTQHGPLVPLYDADNRVVYVPEAQVDDYLRRGFSREESLVETAHAEIGGLFNRARSACDQLVAGTRQTGVIDRENDQSLAVAHFAMNELLGGFHALVRAIQMRYPTSQAEAATIQTPEGATLRVDPTQADGKSHAVHMTLGPQHDPAQWTEPQRRAAGLITNVPPHLADANDPFKYATADAGAPVDPGAEHAAFLAQVEADRLEAARKQAASGAAEQQP